MELAISYHVQCEPGIEVSRPVLDRFVHPKGQLRFRSSDFGPLGLADMEYDRLHSASQATLESNPSLYVAAMQWLAQNYKGTSTSDRQEVQKACQRLAKHPPAAPSSRRRHGGSMFQADEQGTCWQIRQSFVRMHTIARLFLRATVWFPGLLVTACYFVALHVANAAGLGDEEYDISQINQGQLCAVLEKPSIDVGRETHEMLGLVLGFLLAFQAQQAADRYAKAGSVFQQMCAALQDASLRFFAKLKNCDATSFAKLHWEFARCLHLLLFLSSRDLQTGSLKRRAPGLKETRSLFQQLDGIVTDRPRVNSAVHLSLHAPLFLGCGFGGLVIPCSHNRDGLILCIESRK